MAKSREMLTRVFVPIPDMIRSHARERGARRALVLGDVALSYSELDIVMDRVTAGLQRDGVRAGQAVAIIAGIDIASIALFFAILRAGCVAVPIAPSASPEQRAAMLADSGAPIAFVDASALPLPSRRTTLVDIADLESWLPPALHVPVAVTIRPDDPFNLIYSSGTTGVPKGIEHSHGVRWTQTVGWAGAGFEDSVAIAATPIYSNTTLTLLIPTLVFGGTIVILDRFDARRFLALAERERATHAMLVPVQYQRIMAVPDFDRFDLASFRLKVCTSAPFAAELKADIVRRWPGHLLEIYGMTEGGGLCTLEADIFPDKLHTVGRPATGSDVRIIDTDGHELPRGGIGEVVGRSPFVMMGYHHRADATDAATWFDADGNRFIRHGDLGRFDEDGFLILLGRSKDMIISGGFNIYPPDLEAILLEHPGVAEAAVIGVPSERWGETPYAFYVPHGEGVRAGDLVDWLNARVGKTQRLSGAATLDEMPRSTIGKVLKRALRDRWNAARPMKMEIER